ncbi:MAG: hypothetical protein WAT39_17655 [Planctomycetota bacterium]
MAACATATSQAKPSAPLPSTEPTALRWALVCEREGVVHLVDPESRAVARATTHPLPRQSFEVMIDGRSWQSDAPVASPDGTRVAAQVMERQANVLGCRTAWRALPDGSPVVMPSHDGEQRWPLWTADGRQLLFAQFRDGVDTPEVMVHDCASGRTVPFHDQAMQLLPRPQFDRDGRWIHLRRRRDEGRWVQDIAVVGATPDQRPEVLFAYVPKPLGLLVSADANVVWLVGRDSLWRYDRRVRQLTHSWLGPELNGGKAFDVRQWFLRPGGGAVALELFPPRPDVDFGHGGPWQRRDAVALIEVPELDGRTGTPKLTRLPIEPGLELRGFVQTAWPPQQAR